LKAGVVKSLEDDSSSSYRYYAYGEEDFITTPAQEYIDLGSTVEERQTEFRAMAQEAWERFCEAQEWEHIDDEEETLVAKGRVDLKKLVAMSDFEDEYLEKLDQRDKELNRDSHLFTQDALDAMTIVRERQGNYLQELMRNLAARGIPSRVVRQFWACEEFIVDFVESHRKYFGLSGPT
jgi:hypothetical protein